MNNFIFITDLHCKVSSSVRTGDLLDDICSKLQWTVDYANKNDAQIIIGGDLFDKPSVPDLVKNKLIPVLKQAKYIPLSIDGNHDVLYGSEEFVDKTSYGLFSSSGIIKDFTNSTLILDNVVITNELPVVQRNKPQIVVYHGFLNVDDGRWTFRFDDIKSDVKDQIFVCLGHDHIEYEPLRFGQGVKIIRPGSFTRVTREEPSYRTPKLVHIKLKDGVLMSKTVEISVARSPEEVFTAKQTTITKAQQKDNYEAIISQIKNANTQNMTFEQALNLVATESVCSYVLKSLEQSRLDKQFKNKNL